MISLKERKIGVERDIRKIETYVLKNKDDPLNATLERIAQSLLNLNERKITDDVFIGLVDILSINFELFQNGKVIYASILRQILRICGLVMSCIWQISDIDVYICSSFEDEQEENRLNIARTVSHMQRFASYLHEIESTENIFEKDILEMKHSGSFCEELECLSDLRERTKKDHKLIGMYVKLSVLQQIILWQMYAVAKQPGHSDKIANHLHRIICLQKDKDVSFFKICKIPGMMVTKLVKKYTTCLCCKLQTTEAIWYPTVSGFDRFVHYTQRVPLDFAFETIVGMATLTKEFFSK